MIFVLIFIIFLIAILGSPLFTAIAGISLINFFSLSGSQSFLNKLLIVPQEISQIANMPLLHSIPLFTFAGYLLAYSKASERLVRLTKSILGWMPAGLALVTLLCCAFFTSFTGASGVTIVALGGLLLPALLLEKYNYKYSLGLVTTSGSIGLLFPPSLPIILFGLIASTSIDKLFIAGIIPGIIIILIFFGYSVFVSLKDKVEIKVKFDFSEFKKALWEMKWELPLPILLFGGIYSGKMAISDSAAFTCMYVIIVELFLTKDIKLKDIPKIMKESMTLVGAILIILSVSLAATNYVIYAQVPQKLFLYFQNIITNKWIFLICLNIFLLVVGCLMDIFSALVVVVPLILPLAELYNINPIHLGIIFLANLEIGYLTPPIGMNLFISSIRFNKPIIEVYKSVIIFILLSFISLGLITYFPKLSLWFIPDPSIVGQWEFEKDQIIDRIVIKANGKYIRSKGSMLEIMANDPIYDNYEIKNNILILHNGSEKEEYVFEIYNEGKRILLTNLKNIKEKIFYENKVSPPLDIINSKFIAKWSNNNISLEFNFNGELNWEENNEVKIYYYTINKNKIILRNQEDLNKKIIYNYEFNNNQLIIFNKNKNIVLNFTESISDL